MLGNSTQSNDPDESPRPVLRGLHLQVGYIGLDSLYVILEYPHIDVFDRWTYQLEDLQDRQLHQGIVTPDEFVIKRGAHGYKLSIWDGDARMFITDQVEDKLAGTSRQGQGMGLMLQLGPKWLVRYGDVLNAQQFMDNILAQFIAFGVINPHHFPCRLNRLDLTLDVIGLDTKNLSIDEWWRNWVGYAKLKSVHFGSQSGHIEGLVIGSYEGVVRFKIYDKMYESIQKGTSLFWRSVWGLDENANSPVTRFEWSVKLYQGRFKGLRYLADFTPEGIFELANYVISKWGRLCMPDPDDDNHSRWALAPLWKVITHFVQTWHDFHQGAAQREYNLTPDLSEPYERSYVGWMAGFRARLGVHKNLSEPASIADVLEFLAGEGFTSEDILDLAKNKHRLYSSLTGKN